MGFRKMSKPDYDIKDMIDTNENNTANPDLNDPDIELNNDDLENLKNPHNILNEIKKDLLKTKKYLDKKIYEAEIKSLNYDKFSQSIFLTKLELAKEKRQVLESLAKIAFEELKIEKDSASVDSITDFLSKD